MNEVVYSIISEHIRENPNTNFTTMESLIQKVVIECYAIVVSNPNISTSLAGRRMKEYFGM